MWAFSISVTDRVVAAMHRRLRSSALCVLLLALCLPSPARAESPPGVGADARKAAEAHFKIGKIQLEAGNYDEAIKEFTAAYQLSSAENVYFFLGDTYRLKGEKQTALDNYQKYVTAKPDGKLVKDALKAMSELKRALKADSDRAAAATAAKAEIERKAAAERAEREKAERAARMAAETARQRQPTTAQMDTDRRTPSEAERRAPTPTPASMDEPNRSATTSSAPDDPEAGRKPLNLATPTRASNRGSDNAAAAAVSVLPQRAATSGMSTGAKVAIGAVVGTIVLGAGLGVGLGVGLSHESFPLTELGTVDFR